MLTFWIRDALPQLMFKTPSCFITHLSLVLFLLLHLHLQFPHHHLSLPLWDGSALLVMCGHQTLHVHHAGLALDSRSISVDGRCELLAALWGGQVLGRPAAGRGSGWSGWRGWTSRWWRFWLCRLGVVGLGFWQRLWRRQRTFPLNVKMINQNRMFQTKI